VNDGDRHFHEDCWTATHPDSVPSAPAGPVAAAEPPVEQLAEAIVEQLVEQRVPASSADQADQADQADPEHPVREPSSEQRDYEQRIASGGLAALLSPYVSGLPVQRKSADSVPA
jgi:hypothetical protein